MRNPRANAPRTGQRRLRRLFTAHVGARLALLVGILCAAATPGAAQCVDYTRFPNVRDELPGDGAVTVVGTYAYTGRMSRLFVHDLSRRVAHA